MRRHASWSALVALVASAASATAGAAPSGGLASIAAFERATAAAHQPDSGGGTTVTRAELRSALANFLHDDGTIDAGERGHLGACLADASWRRDVASTALAYATELYELYADSTPTPVTTTEVTGPLLDVIGAPGALTSSLAVQEGRVVGAGALTHAALRTTYARAFDASVGTFDPINVRELVNELAGRLELGMPTQDEIDGVLAYLNAGPRPASRLYLATWDAAGRGGSGGDVGGVVVAAVSADRRSVRLLELHVWTE